MKALPSTIESPVSAAALFRAALPKEQTEERVFVLPLDGSGKAALWYNSERP